MAAKNINIKWFALIFFTFLLFFLFFIPFPSLVDSARAVETCIPIDFGNPPTVGTISTAGEVDCYTFEGVSGNVIRVDAEATSGALSPYWQVLESGDVVLCDWEIIGPSDCLVSSSGTHKIYVKAFGDVNTGSYRIYVQRLDDPVRCTGVSFGDAPVAGSISAAAQENCYQFSGVDGDIIRLDIAETSGAIATYWQVLDSGGTVVCDWEIIPPTDCTLLSNGTHTIMIKDFGGTNTGAYRFYIQRLNSPVGCTGMTFNAPPVAGSFTVAAQENCYQFSGVVGDIIRLDIAETSGAIATYWQVLDSGGTVVCDWEIIPPTDCTLLSSGTHTVMIKDFGGTNTGTYRFYIQRLNSPVSCTGVAFGALPVAGSLSSAAQENCYQFNGSAGDIVRVDMEKTSGGLTPYWQLVQPDGLIVCDWEILPPSDCELIATGMHTIVVRDFSGTGIGSYRLFSQRLNSPLKCITVAYGGFAKKRTIKLAAQENCIRFNGNAGDQVKIYTFKTSGKLTPYWQVIQPNGIPICDWEIISPSDCILGSSGMHTIMVRDFGGTNKGEYYISACTDKTRCRLILVSPPVSQAGQDGWIRETGETTNKGGLKNTSATTLRLGDSARRQQYRSILSFVTSSLPDDAVLTRVFLNVKKQGIAGGGNPVNTFHGFMVDIKKGFFNTSTSLQSVDFQSKAGKSIGPYKPTLRKNWYSLNLTNAKGFVNKLGTKGGLTQIRLRFKLGDNNNSVANYLRLYSGNASVASKPHLIIEYYIP